MLLDPSVAGVTRLSATDTVRARIALAIEHGLLRSGEQLPSDTEIADALGVSEITARRALKSLADENVLTRRRGRKGGTFVADEPAHLQLEAVRTYRADEGMVHRLIDQRTLIECALTHQAARSVTDDQLDQLRAHVAEAANAKNWAEYHAADDKLHQGIAVASGMEWAVPYFTEVCNLLYAYFLPYSLEYLHEVNREHSAIVDALEEHDCVKAVELMRHHDLALHGSMFVGLPGPDAVTPAEI